MEGGTWPCSPCGVWGPRAASRESSAPTGLLAGRGARRRVACWPPSQGASLPADRHLGLFVRPMKGLHLVSALAWCLVPPAPSTPCVWVLCTSKSFQRWLLFLLNRFCTYLAQGWGFHVVISRLAGDCKQTSCLMAFIFCPGEWRRAGRSGTVGLSKSALFVFLISCSFKHKKHLLFYSPEHFLRANWDLHRRHRGELDGLWGETGHGTRPRPRWCQSCVGPHGGNPRESVAVHHVCVAQ